MSAFLLLILFTIQMGYSGIVTALFYANQHYIATVLCVNKEKKEMACNGNCALNKKLSEAEGAKDEQAPIAAKKSVEESPLLIEQFNHIIIENSLCTVYFQMPDQHYQFDPTEDIFHPPATFLS